MPKSTAFSSGLLGLTFNANAIANLAQNNGTSPATTLTVALHTADPGIGGTQSTSEISYTGYARVAIARTSGGWTITSASVSPVANIDFGAMTGGTGGTATHFSVGTGTSNAMLYSGPISPTIAITTGVTPRLTTASVISEA